jgi:site-specific recombinase XerD
VQTFLTHLAAERRVSASTQNQALNALVFLYHQVLGVSLEGALGFERARRSQRLPVVLTQNEVRRLLAAVAPAFQLSVRLPYGSGLRWMELLRLRVKDVDVARRRSWCAGKGDKDRVTMLPEAPVAEAHLTQRRQIHEADIAAGHGA